jgi:hypothetical protein
MEDHLMTGAELFGKTERELSGLFQAAMKALVQTQRYSPERRQALAAMNEIERARAFAMAR